MAKRQVALEVTLSLTLNALQAKLYAMSTLTSCLKPLMTVVES